MVFVCPPKDCAQCPRLVEFRKGNMAKFPTYYNGPVPPFGPIEAEVLIVGLAPGLTGDEVHTCGKFLTEEIGDMKNLKIVLTLGSVAHSAVLGVLGYKKAAFKFAHGAVHRLEKHNLLMVNSYHTSRYNINTGVLTYEMFEEIIRKISDMLKKS